MVCRSDTQTEDSLVRGITIENCLYFIILHCLGSLAGIISFFRAPFSRSRSVVKDCFTGQPPGKAISIPAAPDVQRSQTKSKP